ERRAESGGLVQTRGPGVGEGSPADLDPGAPEPRPCEQTRPRARRRGRNVEVDPDRAEQATCRDGVEVCAPGLKPMRALPERDARLLACIDGIPQDDRRLAAGR